MSWLKNLLGRQPAPPSSPQSISQGTPAAKDRRTSQDKIKQPHTAPRPDLATSGSSTPIPVSNQTHARRPFFGRGGSHVDQEDSDVENDGRGRTSDASSGSSVRAERRRSRRKKDRDSRFWISASTQAHHLSNSLKQERSPSPQASARRRSYAPAASTSPCTSRKASLVEPTTTTTIASASAAPPPGSSPSRLSWSVNQTFSVLQNRYALRRQASQTFKDMQQSPEEADAVANSSAISAANVSAAPGQSDAALATSPSAGASTASMSAGGQSPSQAARPLLLRDHSAPRGSEGSISDENSMAPHRSSTGQASSSAAPFEIPAKLQSGITMLKVTHKKVMQRLLRVDADRGQILWASKKGNRINLEAIRDIRIGPSGASFRTSLNISVAHEPRWISIVYQQGGAYKALHLIALSDESLALWKDTLQRLQGLKQQLMGGIGLLEQRNDLWLRQHWKKADFSDDERLDFGEVVALCRRLGIESSRKDLREKFNQADSRGQSYLDFQAFQTFVTLLKRRGEIEDLYNQWADVTVQKILSVASPSSGSVNAEVTAAAAAAATPPVQSATLPLEEAGSGPTESMQSQRGMSFIDFGAFLDEEQEMQHLSNSQKRALFDKFSSKRHAALLLEGFTAFLQSIDNAALKDLVPVLPDSEQKPTVEDSASSRPLREAAETAEELLAVEARPAAPAKRVAPQDMTRPLSEYFISSSHNTYLVGGQWKGDSTTEGYIRALQQGARCVELDCWDGPNGQPQITHGHTLTSRVSFREVISAIARYAFVSSAYPVILSLEVHSDVPQQTMMAKILREILGDSLLSDKLPGLSESQELPSPEQLRNRILVKAKNVQISDAEKERAAEEQRAVEGLLTEAHTTTDTTETGSESDGLLANARDLVRSVTRKRDSGNSARGAGGTTTASSKPKKVLISPELASLLVYTVGVKHRGINKRAMYAPEHMISLSEKTAFKYVRDKVNREDLIKHNRTHLTRTYPSMASIARLHASANYLPHHVWAVGCQLVALNWQTLDLGFALNQAMFARNASSGYVLKPIGLRTKDLLKSTPSKIRCVLEVTIVSAQQLPRFKDVVRDKENDDSDVLDPMIAISLFTPESWGLQPQEQVHEKRAKVREASSPPSSEQGRSRLPTAPTLLRNVSGSGGSSGNQSTCRARFITPPVKGNGFNPIWNQTISIAIEVPAGESAVQSLTAGQQEKHLVTSRSSEVHKLTRELLDLAFLRFEVCEDLSASPPPSPPTPKVPLQDPDTVDSTASGHSKRSSGSIPTTAGTAASNAGTSSGDTGKPSTGLLRSSSFSSLTASSSSGTLSSGNVNILASYVISVGGLQRGYRHLPLYDGQLQQYPFSTLFIRSKLSVVGLV